MSVRNLLAQIVQLSVTLTLRPSPPARQCVLSYQSVCEAGKSWRYPEDCRCLTSLMAFLWLASSRRLDPFPFQYCSAVDGHFQSLRLSCGGPPLSLLRRRERGSRDVGSLPYLPHRRTPSSPTGERRRRLRRQRTMQPRFSLTPPVVMFGVSCRCFAPTQKMFSPRPCDPEAQAHALHSTAPSSDGPKASSGRCDCATKEYSIAPDGI